MSAQELRILGQQSAEDTSHSFYRDLLTLTLQASSSKAQQLDTRLIEINFDSQTQHRSMRLLDARVIDVIWAGTNVRREQRFEPVYVPILRGLLGYRVFIIHKDNAFKFNNIDEAELKSLVACQGDHWPDSDILEANGYLTLRVARYDLLFKMLQAKRCDYFPRSVFEGYSELISAKNAYPDLEIIDNVILHYDFPMYFFVKKGNTELAEQLTQGLTQIITDGRYQQLIEQHNVTRHLFPLTQWQDKTFLSLQNPKLPAASLQKVKPLFYQLAN